MLSRRKALSSGVAAVSALVLAGMADAPTVAIAAPPTHAATKPFIPQPARVPADYISGC